MSQHILINVKECLKKTLKLSDHDISDDAKLKDDYGLDSMSTLTFLLELEDNIPGFSVDPQSLEPQHLLTVKTVSDYVLNHIAVETQDDRSLYH